MTTQVDVYFTDGCGRCSRGGTPACKIHTWLQELLALRNIVLDCGLQETCKWGVPCYMYQDKNIIMLSALNDCCVLSFFKGSLLHDEHGILSAPGENAQVAKVIRFSGLAEVRQLESILKTYIFEAIEIEKAGLKVPQSAPMDIPEELQHKFDEMPALQVAFEALTPGRQRGYLLYFTAPKQSATRMARIEKYVPKIFAGVGFHD